jgi:hypothetical protein
MVWWCCDGVGFFTEYNTTLAVLGCPRLWQYRELCNGVLVWVVISNTFGMKWNVYKQEWNTTALIKRMFWYGGKRSLWKKDSKKESINRR